MKIKSNSIPVVAKLLGLSLVLWDSKPGHLLYSHLRYYIKGGETSTGKALLVLAHLDGIQPLIHSVEAGVIWDCAVKEGEVHPETQKWAMTNQELQAPFLHLSAAASWISSIHSAGTALYRGIPPRNHCSAKGRSVQSIREALLDQFMQERQEPSELMGCSFKSWLHMRRKLILIQEQCFPQAGATHPAQG